MYLTVTLNPSIDHYVRLPSPLKTGDKKSPATSRSISERTEAGGKGINVARVLRKLGAPDVAATGFVGGFTGERIEDIVKGEKIETSFVKISGQSRINTKISDNLGIETEINGAGPDIPGSAMESLVKICEMPEYDTIFLSGSFPASLPSDTYGRIMKKVLSVKPECRFILDFAGEGIIECLKLHPFLVKPNAAELGRITGREISVDSKITDIRRAAELLIEEGAANVLVSLGPDGALLLSSNGDSFRASGISGNAISTIGAGDTMLASFIFHFDNYGSMHNALEFANRTAAMAVFGEDILPARGQD